MMRVLAECQLDGCCLRAVIERGARAMRVDVVDVLRLDAGILQGLAYFQKLFPGFGFFRDTGLVEQIFIIENTAYPAVNSEGIGFSIRTIGGFYGIGNGAVRHVRFIGKIFHIISLNQIFSVFQSHVKNIRARAGIKQCGKLFHIISNRR